jgi:hypothetical protein
MSQHSFDCDVAEMVGVIPAIIFHNIKFWCHKSASSDRHFHEGTHWSYQSVAGFSRLFPYLSDKQVRTAIDKLVEAGLLGVGNFNEKGYDRTRWFCLKRQMDLPSWANGFARKGEPIPDGKPDSNPDNPHTPKGDLLGDLPEASKQDAEPDHFAEFWKAYPTGPRKTDKPKAKLAFNAIVAGKRKGIEKMDPAAIVAAVKRYEASNPDTQYVPLPTTWLNGARWDQFPEQVERRRGGQSIPYFGEITR